MPSTTIVGKALRIHWLVAEADRGTRGGEGQIIREYVSVPFAPAGSGDRPSAHDHG